MEDLYSPYPVQTTVHGRKILRSFDDLPDPAVAMKLIKMMMQGDTIHVRHGEWCGILSTSSKLLQPF